MGRFKPGTTYIYEKADGITYAREFGSSERRVIGWDYSKQLEDELLYNDTYKKHIRKYFQNDYDLMRVLLQQ